MNPKSREMLKEELRPIILEGVRQSVSLVAMAGNSIEDAEMARTMQQILRDHLPEIFFRAMRESRLVLTQEQLDVTRDILFELFREIQVRAEN